MSENEAEIQELLEKSKLVFGERFGGLYSEAPAYSFPDGIDGNTGELGGVTIGALLAVSAHQKGHFEKNETMDAVKNADEIHDLLSITGNIHINTGKVIRCENLTFSDGSHLSIDGGVSPDISPANNLVVIAAKKVVVRTPTVGAGLSINPGSVEAKPAKPAKAPDGASGGHVGASGTNGTGATDGTNTRSAQPRLMRQFVVVFDEIEVTDPDDPTANYPALVFNSEGINGRDAGDGGDGGHGGQGAQGSSSVVHGLPFPNCAAGPGPGGNGGDGGRAGNGGASDDGAQGGNLILMSTVQGINKMLGFEFLAPHGKPGRGGSPGAPGNFGWHGAEGNASWPCTHAGRDGRKGLRGRDGLRGAHGSEDGHRGRIYYEILSQAEFDSLWA